MRRWRCGSGPSLLIMIMGQLAVPEIPSVVKEAAPSARRFWQKSSPSTADRCHQRLLGSPITCAAGGKIARIG